MQTKEDIEALSKLIRACGLVGATYKVHSIIFSDGNKIVLDEKPDHWIIQQTFQVLKVETIKTLVTNLLTIHLKIIQEKA